MDVGTAQNAVTSRTGIPRPSRLPVAKSTAGKSLIPKRSTNALTEHTTAVIAPAQDAAHKQVRTVPSRSAMKAPQTKARPSVPVTTQASGRGAAGLTSVRSQASLVQRSTPAHDQPTLAAPIIKSMEVSGHDAVQVVGEKAKNSRLSLAERTMESIAKVPPSPVNRRRRSSFFQQESPMPRSRPASALSNAHNQIGEHSEPVPRIKPEHIQRFDAASSSRLTQPVQRPVKPPTGNSARPSLRSQRPLVASVRDASPSKKPATGGSSKTVALRSKSSRPALAGLRGSPNTQMDQAQDGPSPKAIATAKSSLALKEQIRAARAAQRKTSKPVTGSGEESSQIVTYDLDVDPFNQRLTENVSSFRRKIDLARSEGKLNISGLALKEIPEDVIKMYDFEHNKQHSSIAWNETVDLVKFIAAENEIEVIADEVFPDVDPSVETQDQSPMASQFGGIELLDLRGNLLSGLPTGLRHLGRLTSLNLSRNKLTNASFDIITQITSLRELRLADNMLSESLSSTIGDLQCLEVLELQNNKLSCLPEEMSHLQSLRSLNVCNNHLTSLPISHLSQSLTSLLASKNRLSGSLFAAQQASSNLKELDVSINSLTEFAQNIIQLPHLQDLNISFNRITHLPDLSSWSSLITIMAEDNKLSSLPDGFTDSQTLRTVDLTGNDFSKLDPRIGLMDKLDTLKVAANPIRERKFFTMDTASLKRDLKARMGVDQPGQEVD